MTNFNSEPAKEATVPAVAATANISNTALEKKMNEQMTKGTIVFDSVLSSSNASDTNTLTASETTLQKSPPNRINNAYVLILTVYKVILTSML